MLNVSSTWNVYAVMATHKLRKKTCNEAFQKATWPCTLEMIIHFHFHIWNNISSELKQTGMNLWRCCSYCIDICVSVLCYGSELRPVPFHTFLAASGPIYYPWFQMLEVIPSECYPFNISKWVVFTVYSCYKFGLVSELYNKKNYTFVVREEAIHFNLNWTWSRVP